MLIESFSSNKNKWIKYTHPPRSSKYMLNPSLIGSWQSTLLFSSCTPHKSQKYTLRVAVLNIRHSHWYINQYLKEWLSYKDGKTYFSWEILNAISNIISIRIEMINFVASHYYNVILIFFNFITSYIFLFFLSCLFFNPSRLKSSFLLK